MTKCTGSRSHRSPSIVSITNLLPFNSATSRIESQAGLSQASGDLNRPPSSISRCGPTIPLAPTAAVTSVANVHEPMSCLHSPVLDTRQVSYVGNGSLSAKTRSKKSSERARPQSWASMHKPTRALKRKSLLIQLPKEGRPSEMTRSVISAPILTSTTNADVAEDQGVTCGDLGQDIFLDHEGKFNLNRTLPDRTKGMEVDNLAGSRNGQWFDAMVPHERLRKLGDAFKGRLRRQKHPDAEAAGSINHVMAKRRAETLNLCKEKIKNLTGHGHVHRKPIDFETLKYVRLNDPQSLRGTSGLDPTVDRDYGAQYGSISRSFNSALESLEPARVQELYSIRPKCQVNRSKENHAHHIATSMPENQPQGDVTRVSAAIRPGIASRLRSRLSRRDQCFTGQEEWVPNGTTFRHSAKGAGLRMHSDVLSFASPPHAATRKESRADIMEIREVRQSWTLEEAPIFSPSMGDLSQYSCTPTRRPGGMLSKVHGTSPVAKDNHTSHGITKTLDSRRENEIPPLKQSRSLILSLIRTKTPSPAPAVTYLQQMPSTPSPLRSEAWLVKRRPGNSMTNPLRTTM